MRFKSRPTSLRNAFIDSEKGILSGVKIITLGPARDHGVLVDDTTLSQVIECAQTFPDGLPVRFNVASFEHGPASYAAVAKNFRREGDSVVADAHVFMSWAHAGYFLELAQIAPSSFGLSIDFVMSTQVVDGESCARCDELNSVTVVDQPAANSGLFRSKPAAAKPENLRVEKIDPKQLAALARTDPARFNRIQEQRGVFRGSGPDTQLDALQRGDEAADRAFNELVEECRREGAKEPRRAAAIRFGKNYSKHRAYLFR